MVWGPFVWQGEVAAPWGQEWLQLCVSLSMERTPHVTCDSKACSPWARSGADGVAKCSQRKDRDSSITADNTGMRFSVRTGKHSSALF